VSLALTAPILANAGFLHGFSLRGGGASGGGFASLNLGRALGDDSVNVEENHRRLAASLGYDAARLFEVTQVHGVVVRGVVDGDEPRAVRAEQGDALVSSMGGDAVGVRVADCLPLLLADPRTGCVAAVHCGWRGVAGSIVAASVAALVAAGSRPQDLLAAIGPHIRACCFEVGDEVVAALARVGEGAAFVRAGATAKPHVDLAVVVRVQLGALGVPAAQCADTGGCTRCDGARFYSFRRDGAASGRHLAVIVPRDVSVGTPRT
jgi:YfiH family protein